MNYNTPSKSISADVVQIENFKSSLTNDEPIKSPHKEIVKRDLINMILGFNINNLIKIIRYKFSSSLFKSYFRIKRLYEQSLFNKLKSKLIFNKLIKNLKAIMYINSKAKKRLLQKAFYKYKNIILTRNKLSKVKYEVDIAFDKKKEKEMSNIDRRLNEKDKELSESKKQLEINLEHTNELTRKIKHLEEGLANFSQNYKKVEKEKINMEEEQKNNAKNKRENEEYYLSLETKVKEYESELKILNEKNIEKEYSLSLFIKEMNEMLEAHEKINSDVLTINNEVEENKIVPPSSSIQTDTINKQNLVTQKPSIKNTIITSNNLSFKVLPNSTSSNFTFVNKPTNKSHNICAPTKGIIINQNNSGTNLNKLNYAFNKNNVSSTNSSVNIFKSKNIN